MSSEQDGGMWDGRGMVDTARAGTVMGAYRSMRWEMCTNLMPMMVQRCKNVHGTLVPGITRSTIEPGRSKRTVVATH
jgi:hypothetical protein